MAWIAGGKYCCDLRIPRPVSTGIDAPDKCYWGGNVAQLRKHLICEKSRRFVCIFSCSGVSSEEDFLSNHCSNRFGDNRRSSHGTILVMVVVLELGWQQRLQRRFDPLDARLGPRDRRVELALGAGSHWRRDGVRLGAPSPSGVSFQILKMQRPRETAAFGSRSTPNRRALRRRARPQDWPRYAPIRRLAKHCGAASEYQRRDPPPPPRSNGRGAGQRAHLIPSAP